MRVKWNVRDVDASLEELEKKIKVALNYAGPYGGCPRYIEDRLTYIRIMLSRSQSSVNRLRGRLPKENHANH